MSHPIGPSPDPNTLYITDAGVSKDVTALGESAAHAVKERGFLTTAEYQILKATVTLSLANPELPVPDKTALTAWLDRLSKFPPRSPVDQIGQEVISGVAPTHNPYLDTGIMAIVWKILTEMAPIMAKIMLQSAQLEIGMMKLQLEMAKEVFSLAVQAGELKKQKLEQDVSMHIGMAIASGLSIAMTVAEWGATTIKSAQARRESGLDDAPDPSRKTKMDDSEKNMKGFQSEMERLDAKEETHGGLTDTEKGLYKDAKQNYDKAKVEYDKAKDEYNTQKTEGYQSKFDKAKEAFEKNPSDPAVKKTYEDAKQDLKSAKDVYKSKMQSIQENSQRVQKILGDVINIGKESMQAGFKSVQAGLELDTAKTEALRDFLSQLMQSLDRTIQSAEKDKDAASRFWQQLGDLSASYAAKISQAIFG